MEHTHNIINFPIQKIDWTANITMDEAVQNFRLETIQRLNLKTKGKYHFDLKVIRAVKIVNEICLRNGYAPIVEDISQLLE